MRKIPKRTILRCFHLLLSIPVLGYIYEPASEVQEYAGGVRYLFLPLLMLSGYWMNTGVIFAFIGTAIWLGAYSLGGFGPALLSQVILFVARMIWLKWRNRSNEQMIYR